MITFNLKNGGFDFKLINPEQKELFHFDDDRFYQLGAKTFYQWEKAIPEDIESAMSTIFYSSYLDEKYSKCEYDESYCSDYEYYKGVADKDHLCSECEDRHYRTKNWSIFRKYLLELLVESDQNS